MPPVALVAAPAAESDDSTATEADAKAASDEAAPRAATVFAAGVLAASVAGHEWGERVDRALARTEPGTLSKAARLSRRLRRQAARDSFSGVRQC
jgi:hypothetical protein